MARTQQKEKVAAKAARLPEIGSPKSTAHSSPVRNRTRQQVQSASHSKAKKEPANIRETQGNLCQSGRCEMRYTLLKLILQRPGSLRHDAGSQEQTVWISVQA